MLQPDGQDSSYPFHTKILHRPLHRQAGLLGAYWLRLPQRQGGLRSGCVPGLDLSHLQEEEEEETHDAKHYICSASWVFFSNSSK